jgi:hypothetical protein
MDQASALESRKFLEEKLINASEGITRGKQPFSLAIKGIKRDIPEHPDVPVNDLKSLHSDLQQAADLEDILQGLMDEDEFIDSLHQWNQIRERSINVLVDPPDFLKKYDPQLPHELQDHIIDLQKKVVQASGSSINTLSRDVDKGTSSSLRDFDPYKLLGKYWQLYWCLVSEVSEDPAVSTSALYAIGKAQKMPRPLINELVQKFETVASVEDILNVERYVSALRFFNLGLVSLPIIDGEGEPLVALPPLPEDQTYPEIDPELDENALEAWHRVMINWLSLFGRTGEGEKQVKDLPIAARDSKRIIEDLQHLKKEVWPNLELALWKPDSPIGKLESEARLLISLGAALDEGGLDWANMKAMEIISYLDEQIKIMGLGEAASKPITVFFAPYHAILVKAAADVRQRALDRIDRQVINILRDRTNSIKRLQDELLNKPQSEETAQYVHEAIIRTAEGLATDAIQSRTRKDAVSVWELIRDAARPWASTRLARRHYPELPPEVNRIWGELYRHASGNALRVRFAGRRREAIIAASVLAVVALIALGSIALSASQSAQPTQTSAVVLGTSTLNLPATMRFQTAAARATESVNTSTADSTSTVQAAYQIASTQEADVALARTATAARNATKTAVQQIILDQTATATAQIYILRATYEAILCRNNPSYLSYELSPTPEIFPDPGTRYYFGTSPFTVTATWTITNTSECRWGYLGLEPLSEELDVTYSFLRADGEALNIGPENTVAVSETIQIVANFEPLQVRNVLEEWVLEINNQEMLDHPSLGLNVRNWIIPVYPPTRTPTPADDDEP